jgi:asparagine synthetase B (glutamine-hydrolysing)
MWPKAGGSRVTLATAASSSVDRHAFEGSLSTWQLDLPLESPHRAGVRGPFEMHQGLYAFFDGVLHDRDELLAVLRLPATASNAVVIASGYRSFGRAFFNRLRGAFGAAVVDQSAARAIVVRDPLGSSPLYYAVANGRVAFSNGVDALLASAGVSRNLNRRALADRLCSRWPGATETYFADILRVPPGSAACIDGTNIVVSRYWDPVPDDEPVKWLTSTDRFEEVLERAIGRCLKTGRIGVFLSGGLDSISIAALAADLSTQSGHASPIALSLGFPDPGCDERLVQTTVARQLGLAHQLLDFNAALGREGLLKQTLRLNQQLAAPVLNTWAPAYFALARQGQASGVRTILTGSGGDEWMTVSPYLAADLLRRGQWIQLARFMASWQRSSGSPWSRTARTVGWRYGLRPLGGMWLHRLAPRAWAARRAQRSTRQDPHWVAPDPTLRADQRHRAPATLASSDPPHGFYLQDVRTGLDHSIASLEMEEQYQFGQHLQVRFMHPYWDADLVDLLYRVPPSLLMANGRSKAMVRDMLARRFPSLGFERQRKVVATNFLRRLLHAEAPTVLDRFGTFSTLGGHGVVDARAARDFARQAFAEASGARMYQAWELLNAESWARAHSS